VPPVPKHRPGDRVTWLGGRVTWLGGRGPMRVRRPIRAPLPARHGIPAGRSVLDRGVMVSLLRFAAADEPPDGRTRDRVSG
jgi:hypothetical protein